MAWPPQPGRCGQSFEHRVDLGLPLGGEGETALPVCRPTLVAGEQLSPRQAALFTTAFAPIVGSCVAVVEHVYKGAGGSAVYQKGPLDRCLRDVLTMNQHVIGTLRTYEMSGRLLLGLEPLRWLF
jgi:hypothetical protein